MKPPKPRVPLRDVGATAIAETWTSLLRALPLIHRSYGLMRRSRHLSPTSALASFAESLQVAISPCCQRDLLDVILRILPQMPEPLPRRSR
jgi:hypothetical protein